jgi:Zn-dependent protease
LRDSFAIGRVFGIQIRVHLLFPLILAFVLLQGLSQPDASLADAGFLIIAVFMLFGVVFLHELGHSLVAQAFGIQVLDITFWPLGGMARMADLPEKPRVEGLVAIAGPAVNGLLFTAGLGLHILLGAPIELDTLPGYFIYINLAMGIFNLIPAFPMDGGRILRAWLARKRDWVQATAIAVSIGRVFSFFMILAGFYSCVLALIGVWVWWMGARELWFVRMKHKAERAYQEANYPGSELGGITPGFTRDDLRNLEAFRGHLKSFKDRED